MRHLRLRSLVLVAVFFALAPAAPVFCGTTPDYHQEADVEERADYGKMERVLRLTYLVAMDIGNKAQLLPLDMHPGIKSRGART